MNPDIADIAGLRSEHVDILGSMLSSEQITMQQIEKCGGEAPSDIGLPLLLPLTVGIEFEQTSLSRGPKQRFLAISVNPLSIMLSNEDLQLVRAVTEAWTSNRKATKNPGSSQPYLYDSVFLSERLGLGLRKENGHIVVDNVADSATHNFIRTGDLLYAVNGEVISNAAKITLAEIVSRLAMVARPLTLTFSRSLHKKNTEAQQSFLEDPGLESINLRETMDAKHSHLAQPGPAATSQQKIIDKIDISLSSAVLTLMEKEVPLFRGSVSSSKVGCHLSRLEDKIFSLEVSTVIEIEYYNLRIWGWEPFIEPGVIFISSSFQEIYHGLRELAVEIGDRDGGLWLNITDSLGETMSKLLDWREDNGDDTDVGELPLPEAYACDSAAISTAQKDIASRKAANAAFRFATRQKNDTAKPFVFRNRTGLSVAFVKQSHMDVEEHYPRSHSLLGVGEYSGLQQYEPSEIMVVANDEELKFRVDANSCRSRVEGQAEKVQRVSRFPSLTVALQETNGVNADPFKDLQISHPREILLPLTISKQCSDTFDNTHPARGWATWLVEHVDEKTVATLGSSIRVLSLLSHVIEIGIDAFVDERDVWEPSSVMRIGTARLGNPFCLPLWIAMQDQTWRCSARLAGGYRFTPLCRISSDGSVSLESTSSNCIECLPGPGVIKSAWLAITQQEVGGILTICIDCSVAVRNLLPSNIEWEIDEDSSIDFLVENGPSTGEKNTGKVQSLKSGEQAEILSQGWNSMKFRLRPVQDCEWSAWTTLALPSRSKISNNQNKPKKAIKVEEQEESVYTVYMKDAMNVSLPLGLRISRKLSGVDVTVFAELWCTNCTPLDLIFGCPKQQITEAQNGLDSDDTKSKELSVAEATLKEISSLFESGEAGASLTQMDSGSRDNVYDVVRIPGQVASYVTEECFEYLEVVSSTVRRRWWASENPFSPGESISIIDERTGNWDWLDKFWVRSK